MMCVVHDMIWVFVTDFGPFSVILVLLFGTSVSRAFILLSGWLCSPQSRPSWLPMVSTLPSVFFTVAFLVALHLAHFPFPLIKSYRIPYLTILIISLIALLPPLALSLGAHLSPANHGVLSQVAWILAQTLLALVSLVYLSKFKSFYTRLAHDRPGGSHMGVTNTLGSHAGLSNNGSMINNGSFPSGNSTMKKRGLPIKWGCLQARAMFGAALLALTLSTMIIISVAMVSFF